MCDFFFVLLSFSSSSVPFAWWHYCLFSLSENAYGMECVSVCVCYTLVRFQLPWAPGNDNTNSNTHFYLSSIIFHISKDSWHFSTLFFVRFSISFGSSLCIKQSLHFWWVNVYRCVCVCLCSRQWANVSHLMWLGVNASIVLLFAIRDWHEGVHDWCEQQHKIWKHGMLQWLLKCDWSRHKSHPSYGQCVSCACMSSHSIT